MVDLLSTPGSSSGSAAPGVSTRTYYWGELRKPRAQLNALKTREEGRMISGEPDGKLPKQVQPAYEHACIALANHFLADPSPLLRARRTVELGSGIGLLSLIAAKLHADAMDPLLEVAAKIIATDVDEKVLDMLQGNVELNRLQRFVGALKLDWELTADLAKNGDELAQWEQQAFPHGGRPDLILGADIVYDPSLAGHLASTLAWLLEPSSKSSEALIAGTIRNESTWELFLHECRTRQLNIESLELETPPDRSGLVGAEGWEGEGEVRLVRITAGLSAAQ
ncbi:SPOSA6832_04554 [Sporobolomyces salmonicolor]|uniref:SPOSA6832_04554-mRNA-1:cds n=1 Tax=Sporidiobolus salmonicolor TaxID=5005 RepID=A0A0D6ERI1_SPOSA|nr:SPOSA6832_04554 [Sporobolomyces salmonicolor]